MDKKMKTILSVVVIVIALGIGLFVAKDRIPFFQKTGTELDAVVVTPYMIGTTNRPELDESRTIEILDEDTLITIDHAIEKGTKKELPSFSLKEDNYPTYSMVLQKESTHLQAFYWEEGLMVIPEELDEEETVGTPKMYTVDLREKDNETIKELIKGAMPAKE